MRRDFRQERLALLADSSLQGAAFCRAYTELADSWLAGLLGVGAPGVALVAVGGYGRGDLCPGSDLDVLLIHTRKDRDQAEIKQLADQIWYPLWDAGLKLGHGVRSVKEAVTLAQDDLDTATSLLDTRLIAGDPNIAADLRERATAAWRNKSSRWLSALGDGVNARHAKSGEVAFLLEPDLKDGRGGLRDVHSLRWAEAARRILLDDDHQALAAAHDVLLSVRIELHRRTGKAADRLLLQDQDGVAAALGDADADVLMGRLAAAARTVAWTSDDTWDRIRSSLQGPVGRRAARDRALGPGLVLRDGRVELGPDADLARDRGLVLRAAAAAAGAGASLSRSALNRLAAEAVGPGDPWPDEARHSLVTLLGAGRAAIPVLEALDQKGLLSRLVPEWSKVSCKPQRNAYHRFTVDRHLCEAAANAAALVGRVARPDLLLVGTWLHDLGKGYTPELGTDHSLTGVAVVGPLATRMGFPPADVAVLVALVRHHLLLADLATRRDVEDPATAAAVATALGDPGTVELLHALTEADSLATGPAAWSPWKGGLVADLAAHAVATLTGGERPPPQGTFPSEQHLDLATQAKDAGEVVVRGDGSHVTIAAHDRAGLFAKVAGTLTLHGLDVLSARAWAGDDGLALEEFHVQPVFDSLPDWAEVEADLRKVLEGRLSLEASVADRARRYADRPRPPGSVSAVPARTSVTVDNRASAAATVVEVRAPDRLGTLYRITRALADLHLDIRHAKVATLGHEVVDSFYVADANGAKIADGDHAREIERAVLVELSRI
ncbi:MAG: [protein-PII] uridylyltransferase [Actinomycetota bacterium]|nr:[protein-PII] uridylyltransferase [Actinomycetota bacterium]